MMFMPLVFGYMFYLLSERPGTILVNRQRGGHRLQQWLMNRDGARARAGGDRRRSRPCPRRKAGNNSVARQEVYGRRRTGPRIEQFLEPVFRAGGFRLQFDGSGRRERRIRISRIRICWSASAAPTWTCCWRTRAELLLALEQLTMEALGMPAEEHSRVCFDANDYRIAAH